TYTVLPGKPETGKQSFKSWISPQRISQRLGGQVDKMIATLVVRFVQPVEGLILVPQPGVDQRDIDAWDISRSAHALQPGDDLFRSRLLSGDSMVVPQESQEHRIIGRECQNRLESVERLRVHSFLFVGTSQVDDRNRIVSVQVESLLVLRDALIKPMGKIVSLPERGI